MRIIKQQIKKILAHIIIVSLVFTQSAIPVLAVEPPTVPDSPTAPTVATAPTEPDLAPPPPDAPQAPTLETSDEETLAPIVKPSLPDPSPIPEQLATDDLLSTEPSTSSDQSSDNPNTSTQGEEGNGSGNVGDTTILTGDATNDANLTTLANNNLSTTLDNSGGTKIINSENGSGSNNSGSSTFVNNSDTTQNNSVSVGNNLYQTTTTGKNDASLNVGNSTIKTGDANTAGAILTGVNSNLGGVSVSEFNIVDVHTGDLVLDFAANCIINCSVSSNSISNTGNASDSNNTGTINGLSSDNTFQNNDADVANNMTLSSNSGQNDASYNTGGESFIETGNANVSANALTFVNNNINGNVIFGVVDIFGTLIGDIILPELSVIEAGTCNLCQQNNVLAANTNNGANSNNNATVNSTINDTTFQTNDANIENNLILSSTTGNNDANYNTGGETYIKTGDSSIDANTINIANSNIDGGNWWLVIVNKAGQWVGQLLGVPVGSTFAGSAGSQFSVNDNGQITVTNNGNAAGSENSGTVTQQTNNTTQQNNNANIVNNLNLSANTGNNETSNNTGGNNTIKTGDAKIIANLVNFVNNNIKTSGKLIVTVVNVFGSWIGDFVTPGSHKNNKNNDNLTSSTSNSTPSIGGPSNANSNNDSTLENNSSEPSKNNNANNSNNNNNSSSVTDNEPISFLSNPSSAPNPPPSQLLKVAGISNIDTFDVTANDKGKNTKNNGISINLAWLVILIPAGLAYLIIKRKFNPLKFLSHKKI